MIIAEKVALPVSNSTLENLPITCLTSSESMAQLSQKHILGILLHNNGISPQTDTTYPLASIHSFHSEDNPEWSAESGLPGAHAGIGEVWLSSHPVKTSTFKGWKIGQSPDYLFATINFPDDGSNITEKTQKHYSNLFRALDETGYACMLRIWNYIPDINGDDANGLERYRSFCLGRSMAFTEYFTNHERALPAATGIGSLSGNITIAVMATRCLGDITHIENPRQVPAYRYPSQFGPRAPSFARATLLQYRNQQQLYISGTSSVRGSKTVYKGDIQQQLAETLKNIETLISEQNITAHCATEKQRTDKSFGYSHSDLCTIKVYFRHRKDLEKIRTICRESFNKDAQIVYLHTDICREDLDIEIEGVISTMLPITPQH